jgi:hypothetical protein
MNSQTEATLPAELVRFSPLPARPALRKTTPPARGFWLRRLAWIDKLDVPRWAPEGDTSAAVRVREL